MTPPAVIDGDDTDMENGSPPEEEEFTTPRSTAEQPPTSENSDQQNAGPKPRDHDTTDPPIPNEVDTDMNDAPRQREAAGNAFIPALNGETGSSAQDATVSTSTKDRAISSPADTPVLGFPISTALAASLPHNHSRPHHPVSQVSASTTPAPPQNAPQSIKEEKELLRLKEAFAGVSSEILHKFLRNNWRDFLFNPMDDDHVAYILRACMKNSGQAVVERGFKDALNIPKHRSAIAAKVLKHATVAEASRFLPDNVIDAVLVERVQLLPAKLLVNMLADAGRLGYRRDDYIEEGKTSKEDVFPAYRGQVPMTHPDIVVDPPTTSQVSLPHSVSAAVEDAILEEQRKQAQIELQKHIIERQQALLEDAAPLSSTSKATNGHPAIRPPLPNGHRPLTCSICHFTCTSHNGINYHIAKKVCLRQQKSAIWQWGCANCGQKFTTKQGRSYHILKKVCDGESNDSGELIEVAPANETNASAPQAVPNPPKRDPILPPARPTFSTAPRPSTQTEPSQTQPRSNVQVQLSRPPMHTPAVLPSTPQVAPRAQKKAANLPPVEAVQDLDPTARVSPSQLSAAKLAELERQLQAEDTRYARALAAIDPQWTQEEQEKRRISLKNGNASKKSQIRKSFGVTLRMREKDKIASRAVAMASPNSSAGPSSSRPSPTVPAHISPPSGFSPINAPSLTNPSSSARREHHIASTSQSGTPSGSAFGILKHRDKRQRTDSLPPVGNWIPSSTGGVQTSNKPSPGGAMAEISSEDASKKYPTKKVPIGAAQARWEALAGKSKNGPRGEVAAGHANGKRSTDSDADMADAPPAAGRAGEIIEIESSDDDEAAGSASNRVESDKPLPSTEDTESEDTGTGESRPSSSGVGVRGAFMAKRGGRHGGLKELLVSLS